MKKRMQVLAALGILSLAVTAPLTYAEDDAEIRPLASMEEEDEPAVISEPVPLTAADEPEETEAPQAETEAAETEAQPEQTEAEQTESTEAPSTEAPSTEAKAETEAEPAKDESGKSEDESKSGKNEAGEQKNESISTGSSDDGVMTERESAEVTDSSETSVNIIGFEVDPSAYPKADESETTKAVYKYLREELGLNHAGACGVLANMHMESAFSPLALGDGGSSYGLCQWHNERFNSLISYCNSTGQDYNTVEGQLDFMKHELESSFPAVLSYVRNVSDTQQGAYDAGYYWCVYYESPANAAGNGALRGNLASNEYYFMDFSLSSEQEAASAMIASIRSDMAPKTDDEDADGNDDVIESASAGLDEAAESEAETENAEEAEAESEAETEPASEAEAETDPLKEQAEQTLNMLSAIRDSLDAE